MLTTSMFVKTFANRKSKYSPMWIRVSFSSLLQQGGNAPIGLWGYGHFHLYPDKQRFRRDLAR